MIALKLDENDGFMNKNDVHKAKDLVQSSVKEYIEQTLKNANYFVVDAYGGFEMMKWLHDNEYPLFETPALAPFQQTPQQQKKLRATPFGGARPPLP